MSLSFGFSRSVLKEACGLLCPPGCWRWAVGVRGGGREHTVSEDSLGTTGLL